MPVILACAIGERTKNRWQAPASRSSTTSSVYTPPVVRKRGSSVRRTRVPRMLTGCSPATSSLRERAWPLSRFAALHTGRLYRCAGRPWHLAWSDRDQHDQAGRASRGRCALRRRPGRRLSLIGTLAQPDQRRSGSSRPSYWVVIGRNQLSRRPPGLLASAAALAIKIGVLGVLACARAPPVGRAAASSLSSVSVTSRSCWPTACWPRPRSRSRWSASRSRCWTRPGRRPTCPTCWPRRSCRR